MKRLLICATVGLFTIPMLASADVGVSINVGQPGFYGQINLGNAPPPQVIYERPMWVQQGPVAVDPIYLRVPPDHARHWRRYCDFYHACGRPVYFVRDSWYNGVYVPHYREHYRDYDQFRDDDHRDWHQDDHGEHRGWDHDHHDEDHRGDGRWDNDHGH